MYHHYFAIEMYDLKESLLKNPTRAAVADTIVNDWNAVIDKEEVNRTARLSRFLDMFLFGDNKEGVCLHQCDIKGQRPNLCIFPVNSDPSDFVAISDYKCTDFQKAVTETYAYALLCSKHTKVRFAFACTRDIVQLDINFGVNGRLARINLIKAQTNHEKRVAFCLLKKAARNFSRNRFQMMVSSIRSKASRSLLYQKPAMDTPQCTWEECLIWQIQK